MCVLLFQVRVELPLTNMDSAGKLHAQKAIDSVKERGHTNLSGGLLAALEVLYRISSNEASLVESVLLFTDGKANVGIKGQAPLVKATKLVTFRSFHFWLSSYFECLYFLVHYLLSLDISCVRHFYVLFRCFVLCVTNCA